MLLAVTLGAMRFLTSLDLATLISSLALKLWCQPAMNTDLTGVLSAMPEDVTFAVTSLGPALNTTLTLWC